MRRSVAVGVWVLVMIVGLADVAAARAPSRLTGTFRVRVRITEAVNFAHQRAGQTGAVTWSFKRRCADGGCATVLLRRAFNGVVSAMRLRLAGRNYRGALTGPLPCLQRGKLVARDGYTAKLTVILRPKRVRGGKVQTFSGAAIVTGTPTAAGRANHCGPARERFVFTS